MRLPALSPHRARRATPRAPAPSAETALLAWAFCLLTLWLVALWAGPVLLDALGMALNPHGHRHLHAHGHPFVDARTLLGLPNAMDVLSNLPLALAGAWGLWTLPRVSLPEVTHRATQTFFAGLLLTGLGSAWYHWAPDAAGLVWDRLGMAVTFAGALSLAVAERVGQGPARPTLWVALGLAVVSAALPQLLGNVLPWAVVQFGGMALIVWAVLQRPTAGAIGIRLGALIAWYALAKALELGDEAVFHTTGDLVSGHTLKHIAAALAAWPVLAATNATGKAVRLRQNAADPGAARA
ncbi:hypothetical protein ACVC7V_01075 [Hydrogenophaga sp. A37]|uniref:hypothetical protein n=1 Tax=Hydrogenophaga sp. A37 TaxID=1945864 RepID=UPI000985F4EF|nr:hypothetical protein [Hydrogenophaga sp. A37]OOG81175.1 hypothetical protein B0E41_18735 [Hydrogenophaga sp. A37]